MAKGKTLVKYRNLEDEDVTAHSRVTPIGACLTGFHEALGVSRTNAQIVFSAIESFRFRDGIYMKFGTNRMEVWCLLALHGFLNMKGKPLVSRNIFIDYLSGSMRQRNKCLGYVHGLLEKKCLSTFEYISSPDSVSLGITDFGFKVIEAYYTDMDKLFVRYMKNLTGNYNKSASVAENIPSYYRPY